MNDPIERQDAINVLLEKRSLFCDNTPESFNCLAHDEKCRVDEIDSCIAELVNLPSTESEYFLKWNKAEATNEEKWIPVDKRLPEEHKKVLVQAQDLYYTMGDSNGICIGWRNGPYWSTFTAKGHELIRYPVAWMELPKPYEDGDTDE